MERTRQYRETFIQYLESKNIFSSFSYFTPIPPESFMAADKIVEIRTGGEFKTKQALDDWSKKQPNWMSFFEKLRKVDIPGTTRQDFGYLEVSDAPLFQWQRKHLLTDLQSTILNLSLFIIESILLFYLSFVAFIRYDVR